MPYPNVFSEEITQQLIERLNHLTPESRPLWGKMAVGQMLAHCCVPYEMTYENIHPKPGRMKRFFLRLLAKNLVTGEKPYRKSSPTAPAFVVKDDRDFETEKKRLIGYLERTQSLGEKHFEQKEYISFGRLTLTEWNNMFYKHLDHHLRQFGV
jgi:hypothetical protein